MSTAPLLREIPSHLREPVPGPPEMKRQKKLSLFDRAILRRALLDSFVKLAPRRMMKNPVMFLVEVGAVLTTILLLRAQRFLFPVQITLWLWATVLFANFAEAVAEGRGKAQADALRKSKTEATARREIGGRMETVAATQLRAGD